LPDLPSSIASPSPIARHCTGWRTTKTLPVGETFSVLDVGYGQGDLLHAIARWADPRRLRAQLSGIDLNPRSAIAARSATPPGMTIGDRTCDVFSYAPAELVDFIVSSQSTHHLSDTTSHNFHKNRCDYPRKRIRSSSTNQATSPTRTSPNREVWEACCSVQLLSGASVWRLRNLRGDRSA
jgi:SAM-dependent methyltransferase